MTFSKIFLFCAGWLGRGRSIAFSMPSVVAPNFFCNTLAVGGITVYQTEIVLGFDNEYSVGRYHQMIDLAGTSSIVEIEVVENNGVFREAFFEFICHEFLSCPAFGGGE